MHSLYYSVLAQHPRQLTPIRCAASTISQLHRYFEEVVLENSLKALVVESLPLNQERSPGEINRVIQVVQAARNAFLFVNAEDPLAKLVRCETQSNQTVVLESDGGEAISERFVVIADQRFSALLATTVNPDATSEREGDLVVWTFEPDVVYSALEYLMARITAEHSDHSASFAKAVRLSMPKATSLQFTLGVTTKLARLLQEQAEREIALNRIATAIRNSLELDRLLLTAANEVGRALNARSCVVRVLGDLVGHTMTRCYFRSGPTVGEDQEVKLLTEVEQLRISLPPSTKVWVSDEASDRNVCTQAAVPLVYHGGLVGLLLVQSDDPSRIWAENELLLLHTVADQLIVAVTQAHLFGQLQVQALTDELTGCYNRRAFELQLERDLHLATRMRQPLSLLMMDLDDFKDINDRSGHAIGDAALRIVAHSLQSELRAVDSAARFGGDEFAVILPQADPQGALIVGERLRKRIAGTLVPGFGSITASFGVASFPNHASSRNTLVVGADRAMYRSKNSGGNCVSLPPEEFKSTEQQELETIAT